MRNNFQPLVNVMTQALDVKAAKTNPSKFFQTPKDVLIHPTLSRANKIDILRQWEIDARLLAIAEEENMGDGEHSHLGAVVSALIALGDDHKRSDAAAGSGASKLGR
jgi:hypothetical protein